MKTRMQNWYKMIEQSAISWILLSMTFRLCGWEK